MLKELVHAMIPIFLCSWLNIEEREAPADTEGAFWECDSVLLQPAAGLHQRAQPGRQHAGNVQQA